MRPEPDYIRIAPCAICGEPAEFDWYQGEYYCPEHIGQDVAEGEE